MKSWFLFSVLFLASIGVHADPMLDFIMKDSGLVAGQIGALPVQSSAVSDSKKGQEFVQMQLSHPVLGGIKFLLRGPDGFRASGKKYKLLIVAAGIRSGQETVRLLSAREDWIVAGFEYPESIGTISSDPAKIARFIRFSSAHLALMNLYLSQQTWVQKETMGIVGISLGGLFLPSALRLSQALGVFIPQAIFGYTGAHIGPVIRHHLPKEVPDFLRGPIADAVVNLTAVYDPRNHLPHFRGRSLVIRASAEEVFPQESWSVLENLLPQPKSIVIIPGPHIHEGQLLMIQQTEQAILNWLQ